jgi:hypothetical protein
MPTHGPVQEAYRKRMNELAHFLDQYWNEGEDRSVGFVLLVFPFGEAKRDRINYLSNGKREDIVVALKELIARFEGFDVDAPTRQQ